MKPRRATRPPYAGGFLAAAICRVCALANRDLRIDEHRRTAEEKLKYEHVPLEEPLPPVLLVPGVECLRICDYELVKVNQLNVALEPRQPRRSLRPNLGGTPGNRREQVSLLFVVKRISPAETFAIHLGVGRRPSESCRGARPSTPARSLCKCVSCTRRIPREPRLLMLANSARRALNLVKLMRNLCPVTSGSPRTTNSITEPSVLCSISWTSASNS